MMHTAQAQAQALISGRADGPCRALALPCTGMFVVCAGAGAGAGVLPFFGKEGAYVLHWATRRAHRAGPDLAPALLSASFPPAPRAADTPNQTCPVRSTCARVHGVHLRQLAPASASILRWCRPACLHPATRHIHRCAPVPSERAMATTPIATEPARSESERAVACFVCCL